MNSSDPVVDPVVRQSDVICLSETWLTSNDNNSGLEIESYKLCTNSAGKGKGLATYYRKDKFKHSVDIQDDKFQLTKISSDCVDVKCVQVK